MQFDSGIDYEKNYVWCDPAVITKQDVRRIGVVLPEGSVLTPEKLKKTAEEMACEGGYRVIIEWRREKKQTRH